MSTHFADIRKPPKTLTVDETKALLRVTGEHRDSYRDHMLFSVALGTALREHEIVALNVGDIRSERGIKGRVQLTVFKRSNDDASMQEAVLNDTLRAKLEKFLRWKAAEKEGLADSDPLFVSGKGNRLSLRQVRRLFADWQVKAGLERRLTFHALRHTALTNLYRATKDILVVQRVARHRSIKSTTIYAQASDEDVLRAMGKIAC